MAIEEYEYRRAALELRRSGREGRVLEGVVVRYGDTADIGGWFAERFEAGSIERRDPTMNVQHDRGRLLAREGAGLSFTEAGPELLARADLPNTRIADDALELVNAGLLRGLSMEFVVRAEEWDETGDVPLRTIQRAELHGLAVVDKPAYAQSTLAREARSILEARGQLVRGSAARRWYL